MNASVFRIIGIALLALGLLFRYQNRYPTGSTILLIAAALLILIGAFLRFRPRTTR